jgi:alpha-tubulin suppressor-like RCC1 family protein
VGGVRCGTIGRCLVVLLVVGMIAGWEVIASAVGPLEGDLAVAATPSVMTLPAENISGTGATLKGEITALGGPDFIAVSAGHSHSLGVRSDGTLWVWGSNGYGQLGLGDTDDRLTPTQVGSDTNWVAVSAGYYHSLGLRSDGSLWAWGYNSCGQLGLGVGDTTDRHVPTQAGSDTNWVSVSAGYYHSLGLRSDGSLWAWGRNRAVDKYPGKGGQLGLGDLIDRHVPTRVGSDTDWVAVSGGISHSLGVRSDHTLWAWGWNPHSELGLGNIGQEGKKTPTPVGDGTNWAAVSAGLYRSFGVCSDGTLWAWGMNVYGELGVGDSADKDVPTRVGIATNWVAVSGGGVNRFLGLHSDGSIWAWGGVPPYMATNPTQVGIAMNWASIIAGSGHFLGLRSDGTLWSWGGNAYGQLGLGDTTNRASPTQVFLSQLSYQVSFEWGPTTSYDNETARQAMAGGGTFSADISGLTLGAIYHFRAKVEGEGIVYGDDMSFMAVTAPSVTTNDAGSITTSSARLNGDLASLGTASSVTVSFVWGTSSDSLPQETAGQVMTDTGAFYFDLASLDPGGTYYFKAKAVGHGDAVYGDEMRFTTGRSPVGEDVDPARGKRGQRLTVKISGANLDGATNVSFGTGITVENFDIIGNAITAEIVIDRDAEVGPRDVSVTTPMGTDTMTGGFAVTAGSSGLPWWAYLLVVLGGLVVLMMLVAVVARLARRVAS